jgi:hypothetical protein
MEHVDVDYGMVGRHQQKLSPRIAACGMPGGSGSGSGRIPAQRLEDDCRIEIERGELLGNLRAVAGVRDHERRREPVGSRNPQQCLLKQAWFAAQAEKLFRPVLPCQRPQPASPASA